MAKWGRELIGRTVESLSRYRLVWLAFVLIIPAIAWGITGRLTFDQSIESLFSPDDPQLQKFHSSKSLFGGDEFAVVAWQEDELFRMEVDPGDLVQEPRRVLIKEVGDKITDFAETLNAIPGVLTESTQTLPKALEPEFLRERVLGMVRNVLVGEDDRTTAIVLRLQPETDKTAQYTPKPPPPVEASGDQQVDDEAEASQGLSAKQEPAQSATPRSTTLKMIREAAAAHDPPAAVVGEPVQVFDMFRIVQQDGSMLFVVSLVVLSIVIFLMFRNLRWVVLPIVAVIATIVCTEALLVVSQLRLSMVSSMLNSMVTIIVIATSTHVTVHYRDLRTTLPPEEAMKQTLRDLAAPVFWTCATTGVGFLALLSSRITPVRSFGLMMGLAAAVAFGVFALLLPGGILLGKPKSVPHKVPAEALLGRLLTRISSAIESRPLLLWISGLMVMLVTLPGLFQLRIETDFSRNFRETSDIVQSLQFVEANLGGAGSWEVNFWAPSLEELDDQYLDEVRGLTRTLRALKDENGDPALTVTSVSDALSVVPAVRIPGLSKVGTPRWRIEQVRNQQPELVDSLYEPESHRMRIVLRSKEQQPSETKLKLIETVERLANEGISNGQDEAEATGMLVLLTFVIQSLLGDQLVSFAWAACGISLMMMIAFRSFTLGLLSLVPNIFPIVLVIGTMGWLGTPVNIGTAMIASVSMGLTVDSTIHYISAFRRAIEKEGVDGALRLTHQSVGRALVFAHVALIAGFLVLTLSDFIPLVYFGVLLSLSMLGGLIGDLVMLPLLLRWVYRRRINQGAPETPIAA